VLSWGASIAVDPGISTGRPAELAKPDWQASGGGDTAAVIGAILR